MDFCAGPVMLFFSKELMSLYQNKTKYVGCVKGQVYPNHAETYQKGMFKLQTNIKSSYFNVL